MAKKTQKRTISDPQLKKELFKLFNSIGKDNYHLFLLKNPKQFYVYGLYDTENNCIFYIGKGKNKRAWAHFACTGINKKKEDYINNLRLNGTEIKVLVLMDNLNESEAINCESILIAEYYDRLTNIAISDQVDFLEFYQKKHGKESVYLDVDFTEEYAEILDLHTEIDKYKEIQEHGEEIVGFYKYKGVCYSKQSVDNLLIDYAEQSKIHL